MDNEIREIDAKEFDNQVGHAMLQIARYNARIITKNELIRELEYHNDVFKIVDNHLAKA
mgnify:CR=1 FL=1